LVRFQGAIELIRLSWAEFSPRICPLAVSSRDPDHGQEKKTITHDYFIDDDVEVGIVLEGWEVKSLRAGNLQLKESYVMIKNGEMWLTGAHISPLNTASTHINPDPRRPRKLLAHRTEIDRLLGMVERKGYTLVALSAYWIRGRAKLKIGVAKGKKSHDKRSTLKERDWKRDQARILRPS
jgi:SsrA-binding protein